jgi:hypothetical protein
MLPGHLPCFLGLFPCQLGCVTIRLFPPRRSRCNRLAAIEGKAFRWGGKGGKEGMWPDDYIDWAQRARNWLEGAIASLYLQLYQRPLATEVAGLAEQTVRDAFDLAYSHYQSSCRILFQRGGVQALAVCERIPKVASFALSARTDVAHVLQVTNEETRRVYQEAFAAFRQRIQTPEE